MKIIVTGSLGNIGRPLTEELVQKGHSVTVISSKPERQKAIEAMGADAAIGSVEDAEFLTPSLPMRILSIAGCHPMTTSAKILTR